MPHVTIELITVEKGQSFQPPSLQMRSKRRTVNIFELRPVPSVISRLPEICFRKLHFAECLHAIPGGPNHVYVASLIEYGHRFWLTLGKNSFLAKRPK